MKFGSLDKMRITSSYLKCRLGRLVKGLITFLGIKSKARPKKYKKAMYTTGNTSMEDLSMIIREFEKLPYKYYERRRTKHKPTDSYFYPARQLAKCMTRADALNSHVYPVRTEMNATKQIPILNLCSMEMSELKEFLVDENLLQVCSTNKNE